MYVTSLVLLTDHPPRNPQSSLVTIILTFPTHIYQNEAGNVIFCLRRWPLQPSCVGASGRVVPSRRLPCTQGSATRTSCARCHASCSRCTISSYRHCCSHRLTVRCLTAHWSAVVDSSGQMMMFASLCIWFRDSTLYMLLGHARRDCVTAYFYFWLLP